MKKQNSRNKIALLVISIMFGLMQPLVAVQADIKSDLANNLSFETVIENGLKSGFPMSVTLVKIFSSTPVDQRISIVSAAINVAPSDVALIVRTAIRAGVDVEEVVTEAVALVPLAKKVIAQAAIKSGAAVIDVTLATAAGIVRSGVALSSGGALGSFVAAPPVFKGGTVAPITPAASTGGGARVPVVPPSVGISPS